MATVSQINGDIGSARQAVFDQISGVISNDEMSLGDKTKALMQGQATLGITDGVQNLLAKAYNRWQQTGQ